jgi:hypothetical protein
MRREEACSAAWRAPFPQGFCDHGPHSKAARRGSAGIVLLATMAWAPGCAHAVASSGFPDDLGGVPSVADDGGGNSEGGPAPWSYSGDDGGSYVSGGGHDGAGGDEAGSGHDAGNDSGGGDASGSVCGAQSCGGCCDATGNCTGGALDNACGMGGTCQNCTLNGRTCRAGTCVSSGSSDASISDTGGSACNLLSCFLGCCQGSVCLPGNGATACGTFGGACSDCQALGRVCSGGSCSRGPSDGGSRGRLIRSPFGRLRGR